MRKPRDAFESLQFLYFLTVLVGLSPYLYCTKDRRRYIKSKLLIIYSLTFVGLFLVYFYALVYRPQELQNPSIASQLNLLIHHYNNFVIVVLVVQACIQQKYLFRGIDLLVKIAKTATAIPILVSALFHFCLLLIVFVLEVLNNKRTVNERIAHSFSVIIPVLMESQFVLWIHSTGLAFDWLNQQLSQKRKVDFVQNKHIELCEALQDINKAFSFSILLDVGLIFVKTTLNLAHVFENFKRDIFDVMNFVWAMFYAGRLLTICYICQETTNKANDTATFLHGVRGEYNKRSNTILMFSKQLIHSKVQLTAFGFFPLNMTLFFSIIAAVSMYLLILVQMDNS